MKKGKNVLIVFLFMYCVMIGMTISQVLAIGETCDTTPGRILFFVGYFYSTALVTFSIMGLMMYVSVCWLGNCLSLRKTIFRGFVLALQSYGLVATLASGNFSWIEMTVIATVFSFVDINKIVFSVADKTFYYNGFLSIDEVVGKESSDRFTFYTLLNGKKAYTKNL